MFFRTCVFSSILYLSIMRDFVVSYNCIASHRTVESSFYETF